MDLLERLAEALVEAVLPGFKHARKRVHQSRPAGGTPPPPGAQEPPNTPAGMLRFIWDIHPHLRQHFGESFPKYQQAYAQGWVRWHVDQQGLHVWVGPPDGNFHDRTSTAAPVVDPVPAALKALGFKTGVPFPPPDEIRARFRKLAPGCHPDRFPGNAQKETRYKKLTAAYAVLKGAKLA